MEPIRASMHELGKRELSHPGELSNNSIIADQDSKLVVVRELNILEFCIQVIKSMLGYSKKPIVSKQSDFSSQVKEIVTNVYTPYVNQEDMPISLEELTALKALNQKYKIWEKPILEFNTKPRVTLLAIG